MIWVSLCLPSLGLELHGTTAAPLVLCDAQHVLQVNEAARGCGIAAGLGRASALAICPTLQLRERSLPAEAKALDHLAACLAAFTPALCVLAPSETQAAGVLLEVGACLRLFGGLKRLLRRIRELLDDHGHRAICAVAPTAQGARLLALAGQDRILLEQQALNESLQQLPAWLPEAGQAQRERFLSMGIETIGDILQLPRAGVSRRFSQRYLDELDHALGQQPDPRAWHVTPEHFSMRLELPSRADDAASLQFAAQRLLALLAAWLTVRQRAARSIRFSLIHEGGACSDLPVGFMQPVSSRRRMQGVVQEQLQRLRLPAAVYEIELRCDDCCEARSGSAGLFPLPEAEQEVFAELIERLRARLGEQGVLFAHLVSDPRPEFAFSWRAQPSIHHPGVDPSLHRSTPLWLHVPPRALQAGALGPRMQGANLQCLGPTVRLEYGWWDGHLALRDYFIARSTAHELLWVFRPSAASAAAQKDEAAWQLQGAFA